jgi:hypothetical protein
LRNIQHNFGLPSGILLKLPLIFNQSSYPKFWSIIFMKNIKSIKRTRLSFLLISFLTTFISLNSPMVYAEYLWGVDAKDDVYLWTGIGWQKIQGHLKQISVGADGTVWGINTKDEIWAYAGDNQWRQIPGNYEW